MESLVESHNFPAGKGSVLAIVPAHNEAGRIGAVVAAVTAQGLPVLVVDDGSADTTGVEASAAGARVLRLEPNQGKGGALKAGFRQALATRASQGSAAAATAATAGSGETAPGSGETAPGWAAFLTLDGDGQHDPAEIPQFVAAWERIRRGPGGGHA